MTHNNEIVIAYKAAITTKGARSSEELHEKELFEDFFYDYYIEIDGIFVKMSDVENVSIEILYFSFIEKLESFKNISIPRTRTTGVTDEEIRDELMKECSTYATPLKETCQSAVLIAYYIRKL